MSVLRTIEIAGEVTTIFITHHGHFVTLVESDVFKESVYWCTQTGVPKRHVFIHLQNAQVFADVACLQATSIPSGSVFSIHNSFFQHIMRNNLQTKTVITYTHGVRKLVMLPLTQDIGILELELPKLKPYERGVINEHLASSNFHAINNIMSSLIITGEQGEPSRISCGYTNEIVQFIYDTHLKGLSDEDRNEVLTLVLKNLKIDGKYGQDLLHHNQVLRLQDLFRDSPIK